MTIDFSPADEPPMESYLPWQPPANRDNDVDGSVRGCEWCGRQFGRMQARDAFVVAGKLRFKHTTRTTCGGSPQPEGDPNA